MGFDYIRRLKSHIVVVPTKESWKERESSFRLTLISSPASQEKTLSLSLAIIEPRVFEARFPYSWRY